MERVAGLLQLHNVTGRTALRMLPSQRRRGRSRRQALGSLPWSAPLRAAGARSSDHSFAAAFMGGHAAWQRRPIRSSEIRLRCGKNRRFGRPRRLPRSMAECGALCELGRRFGNRQVKDESSGLAVPPQRTRPRRAEILRRSAAFPHRDPIRLREEVDRLAILVA
jgi:hypothetical protein